MIPEKPLPAFLRRPTGKPEVIESLDRDGCSPNVSALNDSETVVGYCQSPRETPAMFRAFVWQQGKEDAFSIATTALRALRVLSVMKGASAVRLAVRR